MQEPHKREEKAIRFHQSLARRLERSLILVSSCWSFFSLEETRRRRRKQRRVELETWRACCHLDSIRSLCLEWLFFLFLTALCHCFSFSLPPSLAFSNSLFRNQALHILSNVQFFWKLTVVYFSCSLLSLSLCFSFSPLSIFVLFVTFNSSYKIGMPHSLSSHKHSHTETHTHTLFPRLSLCVCHCVSWEKHSPVLIRSRQAAV